MEDLDKETDILLAQETSELMHGILPDICVSDEILNGLKLSTQQIRFSYEYVLNAFDSSLAYQIAFGESNKVKARVKGNALLKNKDIVTAYNKIIDLLWESAQKSLPLMLLKNLQVGLQFSMSDFYDDNFNTIPMSQIPIEKRALIENIKTTINPKTGAVLYSYEIQSRGNAVRTLLELLKVKGVVAESSGTGDNDTTQEAREIRNRIFNNVGTP